MMVKKRTIPEGTVLFMYLCFYLGLLAHAVDGSNACGDNVGILIDRAAGDAHCADLNAVSIVDGQAAAKLNDTAGMLDSNALQLSAFKRF